MKRFLLQGYAILFLSSRFDTYCNHKVREEGTKLCFLNTFAIYTRDSLCNFVYPLRTLCLPGPGLKNDTKPYPIYSIFFSYLIQH